MTKKQRLVFCTAAVIIVAAVMLSQAVINTAVMKSDIASRVLRLHIIAEDNEPKNQLLKLCVRDRIIRDFSDIFGGCQNIGECERAAADNLDKIKAAAEDELRYGDLRCSATENAVLCGSTIVALTQTELRLLNYMMKQPEKAYSREELLSAVWGFDSEVETRVTDETLRRIRKKLLQAGSTVSVSTIWGFGYKLKGAERT